MSEELEKLRHKQYVAEKKLTAAKHKITDIGGMKIATYAVEAKNILRDLQSRNERMFLVTFLVVNMADSKAGHYLSPGIYYAKETGDEQGRFEDEYWMVDPEPFFGCLGWLRLSAAFVCFLFYPEKGIEKAGSKLLPAKVIWIDTDCRHLPILKSYST